MISLSDVVLYCIVSIHLYSASCSAHQSEALPVREIQREESREMFLLQSGEYGSDAQCRDVEQVLHSQAPYQCGMRVTCLTWLLYQIMSTVNDHD